MDTLTKKEALERGYEYCGYVRHDFQSLMRIEDLTEEDFKEGRIVLADKESHSPTIAPESIREMIAETMESDWGNDTGDDREDVYREIMKLDFSATAKMINDSVASIKSYKLTKIFLSPSLETKEL
jgi:hypothetical protein